jgi:hypothetical protein
MAIRLSPLWRSADFLRTKHNLGLAISNRDAETISPQSTYTCSVRGHTYIALLKHKFQCFSDSGFWTQERGLRHSTVTSEGHTCHNVYTRKRWNNDIFVSSHVSLKSHHLIWWEMPTSLVDQMMHISYTSTVQCWLSVLFAESNETNGAQQPLAASPPQYHSRLRIK